MYKEDWKRIEITDEELITEAKTILIYNDLITKHLWLYERLRKQGLIEQATSRMRRRGWFYTEEKIRELASQAISRSDFQKKFNRAYALARKSGLLIELFPFKLKG